jgi:hypothetical protein
MFEVFKGLFKSNEDTDSYTDGKKDISPELKKVIEEVSKMEPQQDADAGNKDGHEEIDNNPNSKEQLH